MWSYHGGGGILGAMAGMAFKRIIKFAAIIDGLFVLGLAFLSYRGWITANWNTIQDQTQSFAYNTSAQVLHIVNDTASKFAAHPSLAGEATPISAAIGFTTGFALGVY
ncbi:MAG TPA: FUN14 domain-containing protein [Bacteroidia bacterium]|nr:FUN14 domain-containing protein [Bacteroidia bacterium]